MSKGSFLLPASLVPSCNKASGSFSARGSTQPIHKIGYPKGWRKGATEDWYNDQPVKKFTSLQYRKERAGPFFHEFIVVELDNNTVCRFDRRGDINTRANALTFEGMVAEDTAHVISTTDKVNYEPIDKTSETVLRIQFPEGQDLLTVLGICYGVQKDDETRAYTLTKYNCYFLSWIIIAGTARRTVDWALLGRDTTKWNDLVKTTIDGLSNRPSKMDKITAGVRTLMGGKGSKPDPDPIPFVGMSYLISTLRKALHNTRTEMQTSLAHLILRSTVDPKVQQITRDSAEKAANEAARHHAGQAARDASMEAIVESMWRTILASENGAQIWEDQCKTTEEAVWKAAAAAAAADSPSDNNDSAPSPTSARWERAWDTAWAECIGQQASNNRAQSTDSVDSSDQDSVSSRAKEAWREAWEEACEANKSCVPLIHKGVSEYVEKNLPDSLPGIVNFKDRTASNAHLDLQVVIRGEIVRLCDRVKSYGFAQHQPVEIEEAMRRVWVQTVTALDSEASVPIASR